MKKGKVIIFDLDGTLHQTEAALVPAIQLAMKDLGFEPASAESINSLYGEPLEVFCAELMNSGTDLCADFRKGIRKYQRISVPRSGRLYPGTAEMLGTVTNMGFDLAICSNAGLDYIRLVTSSMGILELFSMLLGMNGQASKTERVSRIVTDMGSELAIMVGDRYHDIDAAVEIGIPSIGCAYGYGAPEELSNADYVVEAVPEITSIVRKISEGST